MDYWLFPYTVLSAKEYRHLSVLLPRLSALEVVRLPAVCGASYARLEGWKVIGQPDLLNKIGLILKGYKEFAELHGESSLLASLGHDQIASDFAESRFRIQGRLKGKHPANIDLAEKSLVDAAVFIEIARDLDEKEIELEASLDKVDRLEERFREILGISDEDEVMDTIESLSTPIVLDRSYLSFMLKERFAAWFRLLCHHPPDHFPVLVTTCGDAPKELLEPFRSEIERTGKALELDKTVMASIPALDHLPTEEFMRLVNEPQFCDLLNAYWVSLEITIASPKERVPGSSLAHNASSVEGYLEEFCNQLGMNTMRRVKMELHHMPELSLEMVCRHFGGIDRLPTNATQSLASDLRLLAINM